MIVTDKTHTGVLLCCVIAIAVLLAFTSGVEKTYANLCDMIDHPYDRYRIYSAIILAEVISVEPFTVIEETRGNSYKIEGERYVLAHIQSW